MFNERDALKLRLEQLIIAEEKTIKEFREERREILDRLRELDVSERQNIVPDRISNDSSARQFSIQNFSLNNSSSNKFLEASNEKEKSSSGFHSESNPHFGGHEQVKKGYHKKTILLRDAAINILKRHTTAVPLIQLKKELETATGIEIKNISLFMTNLAKKEKVLKKATHGQYMYVRD